MDILFEIVVVVVLEGYERGFDKWRECNWVGLFGVLVVGFG